MPVHALQSQRDRCPCPSTGLGRASPRTRARPRSGRLGSNGGHLVAVGAAGVGCRLCEGGGGDVGVPLGLSSRHTIVSLFYNIDF